MLTNITKKSSLRALSHLPTGMYKIGVDMRQCKTEQRRKHSPSEIFAAERSLIMMSNEIGNFHP